MAGVSPSYPLGRAVLVPRTRPAPRTQCRDCAGGGEINGLSCTECEGRGWHDALNPPPESQQP